MTREEAIQWLKVINTKEFGWDEYALQESQMEIRERCEQGVREAVDIAIEALQDRPNGEWKHTITWQPYCSNCEYVFGEDEEFSLFWNYCPMCGAIMENKK